MSTRVQKGNTVFKPVAKNRARYGSEARNSSSDARGSAVPTPANPHATPAPAAASMPPPNIIPHKAYPPSQSSQVSNEDNPSYYSSDASQSSFSLDGHSSQTVSHSATPAPGTHSRANPRPPAIQSLAITSRVSTPIAPRIVGQSQTNTQGSPTRQAPTPIATPSRNAPPPVRAPTTSDSVLPATATTSNPPPIQQPQALAHVQSDRQAGLVNHVVPANVSTVTDAQIDPILLHAVVTALRNVNEPVDNTVPQAGPSTADTDTPPQGRTRRTRAKNGPQENEGADEGRPPKKRAARARKDSRSTSEAPNEEAEGSSGQETTEDSPAPRKRKRRTTSGSATPRKRRSRAPSVPPYDANADPGEEIDPTAVTMAELCDDTGRGRVSAKAAQIMSNHAAWRASNREKRAKMRAIMEAKKYGRDAEEAENGAAPTDPPPEPATAEDAPADDPASRPSTSRAQSAGAGAEAEDQRGDDFDYTQTMTTSRYNVQVRIGPNGETIIDETSLFVDRQEEDETANYTHIEESDTTKFVNSMSYSKKLRGSRWSAEETELFFDALSQFGENYELISYVLPGRDRKACKNKFKAEDKRNPNRITYCLKHRRPYDMQTLARMTGKDFSGPPPEIRAPTPLRMPQGQTEKPPENELVDAAPDKRSRSPSMAGHDGEEVLGDIDDLSTDDIAIAT